MQKNTSRWGINLFFILILAAGHSSLSYADQNLASRYQQITNAEKHKVQIGKYPWILKKDQEGIHVYTRKVSGSAFLEYKANIIVDVPISKVILLFEDDVKVSLWFYQGDRADFIGQPDDLRRVYYFIAKLPWPISARDAVFERTKMKDPVSGGIRYTLISLPDWVPRKKGVVRVIHLNASWYFIPLRNGRTEIYFQQYSIPEGFIPPFIANQLIIDVPFYSLRNFRTLIEEKHLLYPGTIESS